jgi:hypothetical protein
MTYDTVAQEAADFMACGYYGEAAIAWRDASAIASRTILNKERRRDYTRFCEQKALYCQTAAKTSSYLHEREET